MDRTPEQLRKLSVEQKRALVAQLLRQKSGSGAGRRYPLSHGQRAMWLAWRLAPESGAYNMSLAARIRGTVEVEWLRRALQMLVDRHPALRTVFRLEDGEPVQEVLDAVDLPWQVVNASGWREADLETALAREAHRPFDLQQGSLLRATLFTRGDRAPVLLLTVHHIVCDYWSLAVLFAELRQLIPALAGGRCPDLPPVPATYADFVRQEAAFVAQPAGEEQLAYWKRQLGGELPLLDLPLDNPRPPVQTFRGAAYHFKLAAPLVRDLRRLAAANGTTLYTVLLAAFQVLLHRYTGQDDLIVGSFTAGRTRPEFEPVVGYFVNPVALRANLNGNLIFRDFLAQVRRTVLDAMARQEVPFPLLVNRLGLPRDPSRTPVFQAAFVMNRSHLAAPGELALTGDGALNLGGLVLEPVPVPLREVRFDLTLALEDAGEVIHADLQYNTDLFAAGTMARAADHYLTLLAGIAADPDAPVGALPMLTQTERQTLLEDWNCTEGPFPAERCFHELFAEQAKLRPDAPAVVHYERQFTYRELNRRANQLACHLRSLGVGPDTLVGLCTDRSPAMVIGLLGILKAGGAYLPLDPVYPRDRLAMMIADAGIQLVVTQERLLDILPPESVRPVCLDRDAPLIARQDETDVDSGVGPGHLAYVIYTSGSTGRPKGALIEHRGLTNLTEAQIQAFGIRPDDRIIQFASLSFDASIFEIVMALRNGATLYLADREDLLPGPGMVRLLREQGITVATLPPSVLAAMPDAELPDLRILITAGEACSRELVERWGRGRRFFNAYGPTEATVWSTVAECRPGDERVTIGRPILNTRIYLLDRYGQPVPVGVPGELYIGGVGVARGYRNRPELTAERFLPDPFAPEARMYRTGDLARYLPDGRIEFLGRTDHQVKIRGYRIELEEIESVLEAHPAVRKAVVVAREDQPGQKRLVAYVLPDADRPVTRGELRHHLRERLPEYMVPAAFVLLPELPITPNGKVDRRALPAPGREDRDRSEVAAPPRNAAEQQLVRLWAAVLDLDPDQVGIHDNFFDLGGDSLVATRLVARIREQMGVEVPIRTLFETPTVAELAARLGEQRDARPEDEADAESGAQPALRPVPRNGVLPTSFIQHRLWFLDRLHLGNPAYHIPTQVRLRGPLDRTALEQSLNAIVRRHESLRTTFAPGPDGQPVQVIAPEQPLSIPVTDLTELAAAEREREVERIAAAEAQRPFDLARGPLLRVALLRLGPEEHMLMVTLHHIIADGWSVGILIRELAALYAAHREGRQADLSELPVQYADYAVWQRTYLRGRELERQLRYWRERLGGSLPVLDLPTDRPRPPVQTFRGATTRNRLPAGLTRELKALCRREGITLFMALLAAYQTLLSRLSGQTDVIVGSPVAGRNRVETEGLIGCFVNTLALRTDLSGSPTFRELLARVRDVVMGAYAHQDLPFEKMVEALQPQRDLGRSPIFQVMFNLLNLGEQRLELAGLDVEVRPPADQGAKFDLTLYAREGTEGIDLELVYNRDLFTPGRMSELLAQYVKVVEQMVAQPESRISECSLVTAAASRVLPDPSHPLTVRWNGPVHARVAAQARRVPDRVAVVDGSGNWTYAELAAHANRLARRLRADGVRNQDVVAVYAHRSAGLVWALLAILEAGAGFLILDPSHPEGWLAERIDAARPTGFIHMAAAGPLPPSLEAALAERPLRTWIELPARKPDPDGGFLADFDPTDPGVAVGPDDLAYVAFTSGSTGRPRGIVGTHRPLSHFFDWYGPNFGLQETDRFSMLSGLAYDPLIRDIFGPLCIGATLCIPGPDTIRSPDRLLQWLREQSVTVMHLTPAMGRALTDAAPHGEGAGLSHSPDGGLPWLRYALFGGDLLTADLVERWRELAPEAVCVNCYGTTETPQIMGCFVAEPEALSGSRAAVPLGQGIEGAQLLVLGAGGQPVGIGELGEICVRTPCLAQGYLDDEALTRERFVVNPATGQTGDQIYRTGDYGWYRPDGTVVFSGRRDDQVKIRGFRIELGEVEAALRQHPGVREAAAAVRPARGEARLVGYIVPAGTDAPGVGEIRQFLRRQLPDFMIPTTLVPLESLPLTPNGKVDRRALPDPADRRPELETTFVAPRSPLERTIAAVWQDVLQIDRVGIHDNFFDLGGHSLLLVQVHARLRAVLGRDLAIVDLFQYPTVSALTGYLQQNEQSVTSQLDAVGSRVQKQREALRRQRLRRESHHHGRSRT